MVRFSPAAAILLLAMVATAGSALAVDLALPLDSGSHPAAAPSSGAPGGNGGAFQVAGTSLNPLRDAANHDPAAQGSASLAPPARVLPWALPLLAAGGLAVLVHRSLRRLDGEAGAGGSPGSAESAPGTASGDDDRELPGWPPRAGLSGVLALGREAAGSGRYDEAARWFETAIAVKPRLAVAHTCLGMCLVGLQRHDEALDAFRAAIDLDPEDALPRYQLARALARLDRWDEVLETLAPVMADVPDLHDAARQDPAFQPLRDHPRFLALLGDL